MWHKFPDTLPPTPGSDFKIYPVTVINTSNGYNFIDFCYWTESGWIYPRNTKFIDQMGWKVLAWYDLPPYEETST